MNIHGDTELKDVLTLETGFRKFFLPAIIEDIKTLVSQNDKTYESILLRDNTGVIKVLNFLTELKLEVGKVYNFVLDSKGHPYNPVCFLKEATPSDLDPIIFQIIEEEEETELINADHSKESHIESSLAHIVKSDLILNFVRMETSEDSKNQVLKKLTFKNKKNQYYVLRLWPNNTPYYDWDWSEENAEREVYLERFCLQKKVGSPTTTLKLLSEYSSISLL